MWVSCVKFLPETTQTSMGFKTRKSNKHLKVSLSKELSLHPVSCSRILGAGTSCFS